MSGAIETELKLRIDGARAGHIWRHPVVRAAAVEKPVRRSLYSIYYDTPELELLQSHIALRVRRAAGRWIQTVKTEGEKRAGLHQRAEWEAEVATSAPELDKVADSELREQLLAKHLQPVFVTEFRRTLAQLHFDDGSHAELALDRGEIKYDGDSLPLCELELELKSGDPGKLYDLALALLDRVPVQIESTSKAERGYGLLAPQKPRPQKAQAAGLTAQMSVEQGFERVLSSCLVQLQGNEPAVLREGDREGIHQMRVALRRLRAGLALFRSVIPREASEPLQGEIEWLNDELAPARDWDVFVTATVRPLSRYGGSDEALAQLAAVSESFAERSFTRACEALRSERYTRLLLAFGRWLVRRAWRERLDAPAQQHLSTTMETFATEVMESIDRKVNKLGKRLACLTPEERHRLRIRVKKLRYAGEYVAEIFPNKRSRKYLACLSKLQSVLGNLNDATVAQHLLEEAGLDESSARPWVRGWHAGRKEMELETLTGAWEAFERCKPFWR